MTRPRTNTERGRASRYRHAATLTKAQKKWLRAYDAAVAKGRKERAPRKKPWTRDQLALAVVRDMVGVMAAADVFGSEPKLDVSAEKGDGRRYAYTTASTMLDGYDGAGGAGGALVFSGEPEPSDEDYGDITRVDWTLLGTMDEDAQRVSRYLRPHGTWCFNVHALVRWTTIPGGAVDRAGGKDIKEDWVSLLALTSVQEARGDEAGIGPAIAELADVAASGVRVEILVLQVYVRKLVKK